jgi:hypothetical protein
MLTDMRERATALSAATYELHGLETLQQHLALLQPLFNQACRKLIVTKATFPTFAVTI